MPRLPTWVWIVIGLLAIHFAWKLMGTSQAQSWGPIKIAYNKVGSAVDKLGTPYTWTNPGR